MAAATASLSSCRASPSLKPSSLSAPAVRFSTCVKTLSTETSHRKVSIFSAMQEIGIFLGQELGSSTGGADGDYCLPAAEHPPLDACLAAMLAVVKRSHGIITAHYLRLNER